VKYNKIILWALVLAAAGGAIYAHSAGLTPPSIDRVKHRAAYRCLKVFGKYRLRVRQIFDVHREKVLRGPRRRDGEYRAFLEPVRKDPGPPEWMLETGELYARAPGVRLEAPLAVRTPPVEKIAPPRRVPPPRGPRLEKPARGYVRLYHGPRDTPRVALTFDSGVVGEDVSRQHRLIDLLVRTGTPATFFLTGKFVEAHPAVAARLARTAFFELGNHSYGHPDLVTLPLRKVRKELQATQEVVEKATGVRVALFRPPYGSENRRVVMTAASLGLHTVLWDVDTQDYRLSVGSGVIKRNILTNVKNGSIVLMHMNGEREATLTALGPVIGELRRRGYELVTVSALMEGTDGYEKKKTGM